MTHPYSSAAYAEVFAESAEPLWVPAWNTHVLVRDIPGAGLRDAMGPYPLTVLSEDADLVDGLRWLKALGLVAIGLVPDPATAPPPGALQEAFGLCVPFKTHLLVDYGHDLRFSKHHRYEIRKALRQVSVEVVALEDQMDVWCGLYGELVERHEIGGLNAFSEAAFRRLARVDGLTAVAAVADGVIVSMHLWIADHRSGHGYSLLAASSAEGYRRSAAYAVNNASIRLFAGLKTLNLGAGAGMGEAEHGLTRFKKGFANAEAQAHFCGAVLDPAQYSALSGGVTPATPFPAYRFPSGPAEEGRPDL